MALFSLKKISEEAAGRRAYLRGVECYNAGKVRRFQRESGEFYPEFITAEVENDSRDGCFHVEVGFDEEGRADYYACDCEGSKQEEGACKHVVAAMVHKYYADMVAGMETAGELLHRQEMARSDEAARRMINRYVAGQAVRMVAESTVETEKVRLTPVLQWGYRQAELTFLVGGARPYVIKDLTKFYNDMQKHEVVEYGKQLRFLHHPGSFDEESRLLLRFLLGRFEETAAGLRGPGHTAAMPRIGRELPLPPAALDRFFDLYNGREVLLRRGQRTAPLLLEEGNPPFTAHVARSEARGGFTLTAGEECTCLPGVRQMYIHCGQTLYRCSEEGSEALEGYLAALQAGQGSLFIADGDIAAFCTGVLPVIRPYVELEGETELLEQYGPAHLEVEVYLDAPEPNLITARMLCCYGEEKRDPYRDGRDDALAADRLGELRARLVIERYFPSYEPGAGHLILRGDDEQIYRFITEGVEEISRAAAVFCTDRFTRIGLSPPPSVSVGVRLDSGLLDLDFDVAGLDREELTRVLASYRQSRRYHRLRSGQFLALEGTALSGLAQIADGLELSDKELQEGRASVPPYRAMYLDKILQESDGIQFRRDGRFKELAKNMKAVADSDFPVPQSLEPVLRNYQKTGHRWLKTMEQYGFGGILADDMGLGKTLQIISLLLDARQSGNDRPSLVVCPASLVLNWEAEIRRFAPELIVLPILGDAEQRAQAIRRSVGYDVAITSYDLLKRDIEHYKGRLFRYHILDEAQYIKNQNTQNARAVKAVQSSQRFALTGTPIENRLSELWSIFDFLMPGFLYSYSRFRERFESPIVKNGDRAALERLGRMTAPFILRRLKRDVLGELPPKMETVLTVSMEEEQHKLYAANAMEARQRLRQEGASLGSNKLAVLAVLTRLRQICCDPALCYEDYQGGSAKLESCMELLSEAAAAGHKVLLFSQFTSMLEIIRRRLEAEGLRYYLLQGSTPKEKRAAMVDSFNRDATEVFLISLKAGGTGLNLTGADVVIHYDPWWNVSAQNQATDRAHRIGQKNSVQVYKLIAAGTVEEKILRLQESKRELADAVVREGEGLLASMTADQLLEILE